MQTFRWLRTAVAGALALCMSLTGLILAGAWSTGASAASPSVPARAAEFYVGFAKVNITPHQLPFDYLGGDGYQRVATKVINPLWVRALAIAPSGPHGPVTADTAVIAVMDSQGAFAGLQKFTSVTSAQVGELSDLGLRAIQESAASAAHIPAANIVLSTTHDHTAPDIMGVWGGSPLSYFKQVRRAGIDAVAKSVASMHPAWLRRGSANATSMMYNPTPSTQASLARRGIWPVDGKLAVLQAMKWGTDKPLVTLFNVGVHPDVMENTPYLSPDWPAWTIQSLDARYGGQSMFLQGTLGSEPVLPSPSNANNVELREAAAYGKHMAKIADRALAHTKPVRTDVVRAASKYIAFDDTNNQLLLDDTNVFPLSVQNNLQVGHILRASVPPYLQASKSILGTWVGGVRIGNGLLYDLPSEAYWDVAVALQQEVHAKWFLPNGMANDQIGYVVMPAEWKVALAENGQGEPNVQFGAGPHAGRAIVKGNLVAARRLGFVVKVLPADLSGKAIDPVQAQLAQCRRLKVCK